MSRWRSGDLTAVGAGIVVSVAALSPWVAYEATGRGAGGLALGQPSLVVFGLLAGLALIVTGWLRSPWTALVAMLAAFVVAFVLYTAAIPAHAAGAHPGFGMYALGAGGVLALVGAVLNAVEREGATF